MLTRILNVCSAVTVLVVMLSVDQGGRADKVPQLRMTIEAMHSVWDIALSHDGKTLASGSEEGTIKLWEMATGKLITTLDGHENTWVRTVVFSPSGNLLASGGEGMTIALWQLATGKKTATLKGHKSHITSLAFTPDGKILASGSADTTVKLWDVHTGKEMVTFGGHFTDDGPFTSVEAVAFSPDGTTLASGTAAEAGLGEKGIPIVQLWDVATGKKTGTLVGQGSSISCLAFSPDGKILASGDLDKTAREEDIRPTVSMWDVATRKCMANLAGHSKSVLCVTLSPDGNMLASGSADETIKLWNLGTGKCTATLPGHRGRVRGLAFGPDGRTLVSGSNDQRIRIWELVRDQDK